MRPSNILVFVVQTRMHRQAMASYGQFKFTKLDAKTMMLPKMEIAFSIFENSKKQSQGRSTIEEPRPPALNGRVGKCETTTCRYKKIFKNKSKTKMKTP